MKNLFLAEDRILAFEICAARRPLRWKLAYIEGSYATTDVPETAMDLIAQRRRWLNGRSVSIFSALEDFRADMLVLYSVGLPVCTGCCTATGS